MTKKVKKNNYKLGIFTLVIAVGIVGVFGTIQIGKAQQRSQVSELTELANALGGNVEAFRAGLNYLSGGLIGSRQSDIASGFFDVYVENDLQVDGTSDVGRLTQSGGINATSSTGIVVTTSTEAILIANNQIDMTLIDDSTGTYRLPATSTMTTMIPNAGDTMTLTFRAIGSATTASTTIAVLPESGIELLRPEATGTDVVIEGGNSASLRFTRETNTDVTVTVTEFIDAD